MQLEKSLMARPTTPVSPGDRYARLVVIRELIPQNLPTGKFHRRGECECDFGGGRANHLFRLRSGNTKSCGCLAHERRVKWGQKNGGGNTTHGGTGTPEYSTWSGMRARCLNPKSPSYRNYGGRGITICEQWVESFPTFCKDMGPRPSEDHSIDRINNEGNYEPSNCRWATRQEQGRNTRKNVMVTHGGETLCVSEWAERYGVRSSLLNSRLKAGWSFEDAVSPPTLITDANFLRTPISQRTAEWYRKFARLEAVKR